MSEKVIAYDPVYVLWTGGWDSTFQVLRLLLEQKQPVIPVYIIKESRRSTRAELLAMKKIRQLLADFDPATRDLLAPLRLHMLSDIPPDDAITQAFNVVRAKTYIGLQYGWLARFCAWQQLPELQLSIHKDDMGHTAIADLVITAPPGSRCYRMHPQSHDTPEHLLFGSFIYPIFDFTKKEMAQIAESHGWHEIMMQTWFCHNPRHGQPCGLCHPCLYTLAEGLGQRIPLPQRWLGMLRNRFACK